jgi:hypothetical protein
MTPKTVDVATLSGSKWVTEQVGPAPKCADVCTATRTAIVVGKNGPVVAYTGPDSPMLAVRAADGTWTSNTVARGDAGFGLSLAADKSGGLHMAYYDGGANVFVADATADGKITGQPVKVGSSVGGIQAAGTWGTSITTDDKGTRYVAWTDPTANTVVMASDQSGDFKTLNTPGTESGAMPSLKATADGSKIYLAWYDTDNANLQVGTYSDVPKAPPLAVVSPSPQNSNAAPPPAAGCTPNGSTLKLVAPAGAATSGFDTDCLAAPANKPFKIDFSNQDTSPHNVVIIMSGPPSAGAKYIFNNTKPVDPGASATYPIAAQKPGSYFYYCFFHPTVMTGTLVVK